MYACVKGTINSFVKGTIDSSVKGNHVILCEGNHIESSVKGTIGGAIDIFLLQDTVLDFIIILCLRLPKINSDYLLTAKKNSVQGRKKLHEENLLPLLKALA